MKILLVTPSVTKAGGGVSEAVRLLALGLSSRPDVVVEVLALRDSPSDAMVGDWAGIAVRSFSFVGTPRWKFSPALLAALLHSRADVIHLHGLWQFQGLATLLAAARHAIPVVISPHGMLEPWILARSRTIKRLVSRLYQDQLLQKAALFHVLTHKEAGDVHAVLPDASCRIVPNFVRQQDVPMRPFWWRPDWERRTVFGFIGRLHEKKGILELCNAWEKVCMTQPGFRDECALAFCGPNEMGHDLDRRVEAMQGHMDNVVYAGPQFGDDKWRSLRAFDFLCLPSRSEGLPITILESWVSGVPSLMSRECNLPVGFDCGAAIDSGTDSETIGHALIEGWRLDPSARARMGERARAVVARHFSEGAVIDVMIDLYADVIADKACTVA